MDISQPINFNAQHVANIIEIASGHPVFSISFRSASSSIFVADDDVMPPDVVIKIEDAYQRRHVTDPIKVMNVIDPQSKTRQLKPEEVAALRTTIQHHFNLPQLATALSNATRPTAPGVKKPVIIVMKAKKGLIDLGSAGQRENNDKSGVKAIRKILNQPGALEKLGKILAADAFIGNQDRVDFFRNGTSKWYVGNNHAGDLKAIQNHGNFFFNSEGHESEVLGLDAVDPFNQFKDLDTFDEHSRYPGELLNDQAAAERINLVKNLVDDIETILGSRNRKFPFKSQKHLPSNAANQIAQGMATGAREVRHFLRNKHQGKPLSAGLRKRLTALGWLTAQGSIRL